MLPWSEFNSLPPSMPAAAFSSSIDDRPLMLWSMFLGPQPSPCACACWGAAIHSSPGARFLPGPWFVESLSENSGSCMSWAGTSQAGTDCVFWEQWLPNELSCSDDPRDPAPYQRTHKCIIHTYSKGTVVTIQFCMSFKSYLINHHVEFMKTKHYARCLYTEKQQNARIALNTVCLHSYIAKCWPCLWSHLLIPCFYILYAWYSMQMD